MGGLLASAAAGVVMVLMRVTLQVRTVPERALEAVLLLTPIEVFSTGLQRYGFTAKWYGVVLTGLGTMLLLTAIGTWAIARRWSVGAIMLLSLALWLFVMLVLMPMTDAGFFAFSLINGTKAAIGAHLTAALVYGVSLTATSAFVHRRAATSPGTAAETSNGRSQALSRTATPSRRSALILLTGAAAALTGTFAFVKWGPKFGVTRVVVLEPEPVRPDVRPAAKVPTPAATATRVPEVAARPSVTVQPTATAPPATIAPTVPPTVLATPGPSLAEQFKPPPLRRLMRDNDGVVLASGRRPGQVAEVITASDDFYIVSKNAVKDPLIELPEWRLRVDGDVQRSIEIDYRSLRNLPAVETAKTLECISNFVTKCELVPFGCDLISTAQWKGVRLRDVLSLAGGLKAGASAVLAIAADDFTTAVPIELVMDDEALLVYEMNGLPLAREHGYPARVLVPGRYGMKNAKWVVALRSVSRETEDWYGQRNWSKEAVVKTMTRIDTPARDAELPPGTHRMAGIAYAGDRGIQKVEVSTDGGNHWRSVDIIDRPSGRDVWVRWESSFTLPAAATLTLLARATDGTGELQTEPFSLPQPDGSTGWHSLEVRAQTG